MTRDRSAAAVARAWCARNSRAVDALDAEGPIAALVRAVRRECARVADGDVEEWKPDFTEYARGRRDARDAILALNRAPRRGR